MAITIGRGARSMVFKPNAVDERRFHTIFGFSPFRGPASVLRH
jgi:hypothetical protein